MAISNIDGNKVCVPRTYKKGPWARATTTTTISTYQTPLEWDSPFVSFNTIYFAFWFEAPCLCHGVLKIISLRLPQFASTTILNWQEMIETDAPTNILNLIPVHLDWKFAKQKTWRTKNRNLFLRDKKQVVFGFTKIYICKWHGPEYFFFSG